jgi:uncharacterized protein YjiS (DUF1127 family)
MTSHLFPLLPAVLEAARQATEQALRVMLGTARRHRDDWRRRRRARAEHLSLCALDDATLRDLGIDRSELHAIALHPGDPDRLRTRA